MEIFFCSLVKRPSRSYDELLCWTKKSINVEDAQKAQQVMKGLGVNAGLAEKSTPSWGKPMRAMMIDYPP